MKIDSERGYWQGAARKVCLRVNLGFFLQTFFPILMVASLVQGCTLLVLRKWEMLPGWSWVVFVVAVVIATAGAVRVRRRRFFSRLDGLVHLETRLGLHNRLSSAHAGACPWPSPRAMPTSLRWVWPRLVIPPVAAAGFLLLAGWIPLREAAALSPSPPEEPLAWQQVETWSETLAERETADEESLADWREQVQRLREQNPGDWYSHSSLEAGDNLRDSAADSIQQLQSSLQKAAIPLAFAREHLEDMPSGLQPLLQEHWLEALNELSAGALPLNKDLLAQLAQVDFNNLPNLSREQMAQLEQMLRDKTAECASCLGQGECDGEAGTCEGGGETCSIHGRGGISKGPGAAPLTFQDLPSLADVQRREAVSNPNLSRAALGDQLGTTQAAPEVDPATFVGPVSAGTAVEDGDGGETVWRSRLTPAEQRRLRSYFE